MSFERVEDEREGKVFYEGDPRFADTDSTEELDVCLCGHVLLFHVNAFADLGGCAAGNCPCERWEVE